MDAKSLRTTLMGTALVVVSVLGLAACGGQQAGQSVVEVVSVELETFALAPQTGVRERSWDGVVEAVNQATLSAQTGGRVLELPFDVNDYVKAGEVVVRFTDVEQQSARRRADAALAAAQAAASEAEADHRRIAEVFERKLVARAQLDQAIARREVARAQLEVARAAVRESGELVDYTVIRAPYSGILTERHVEVGETVRPGQPLVAGLSLDELRIRVEVPQSDIHAIREHGRAAVLLADGRRIEARQVVVFPFADPQTHSFRVRVELPEADTGLHPGMTVKTAFMLGSAQRLLLPTSALYQRGEVSGVFVVAVDGEVSLRQLRLGHRHDDTVEVVAGLQSGEQVVADPLAALAWLEARRRPRNASTR
jgi:RND family efflux transporter MFP subunit